MKTMDARIRKQVDDALRRARGIGILGLVGGGLLIVALLAYGMFVVPQYNEVASLRDDVAAARARITGRTSPAAMRGEELSSFYGFFPEAHSTPVWLGKIYGAAKETGVVLASGEYQFQQPKGSRLGLYRISLPAHGSYEQVRDFIAAVLRDVPALSLDDISLRRENIESPDVEARLRMTLYLGLAQ